VAGSFEHDNESSGAITSPDNVVASSSCSVALGSDEMQRWSDVYKLVVVMLFTFIDYRYV
jgi:hypothetical protein